MTIALQAGDYTLDLDPDTGGSIAALSWRGIALLQPVRDDRLQAQQGRAVAGYPLFPYANRIANGRFALDGVSCRLSPNFGDSPHSIHGNAWMRRWTLAACGDAMARLCLCHAPPADPPEEWPFAYEAHQDFALSAEGLRLTLSLRNADRHAWPAGLGLHPYVARRPGAALRFAASGLWTTGADELPAAHTKVPASLDFTRQREIGSQDIDFCYTDWDGTAILTMPEHGIALRIQAAPPLGYFQVYTPPGRDFCGLEPVSNMPDGVNRIGGGMVILKPGEMLTATIVLSVVDC